jgi:putative ABC transport system substrate-binding protein
MRTTLGRIHSDRRPLGSRRAQTLLWFRIVGCLVTLACGLLTAPCTPDAQPAAKVHRIGLLSAGSPRASRASIEAFQQGLCDLGYVEGRNLVIESRYAEEQPERLPALAAELVRLPVDVLVAMGAPATQGAKQATSTLPIVMATGGTDPVGTGLVVSLARPGGNVTGVSLGFSGAFAGKWVELLREAVSDLSRVALLLDAGPSNWHAQLHDHEAAARGLGVQLLPLEVRGLDEFAGAFQAATQGHAQALLMVQSPLFSYYRARLAELALANRLPTMSGEVGYAKAGGLMNYGPHLPESWHRAATYVHKLLNGAKPADLPVEQPTKFELVINLKTAKALGMTMPPSLLLLADDVIQ